MVFVCLLCTYSHSSHRFLSLPWRLSWCIQSPVRLVTIRFDGLPYFVLFLVVEPLREHVHEQRLQLDRVQVVLVFLAVAGN